MWPFSGWGASGFFHALSSLSAAAFTRPRRNRAREFLAHKAITCSRSPRRGRIINPLRRRGSPARDLNRIPPLRALLRHFLIRDKGQVKIAHAASPPLIAEKVHRVLHGTHQCAAPVSREGPEVSVAFSSTLVLFPSIGFLAPPSNLSWRSFFAGGALATERRTSDYSYQEQPEWPAVAHNACRRMSAWAGVEPNGRVRMAPEWIGKE